MSRNQEDFGKSELTRRELLKTTGVVAAGAALGAGLGEAPSESQAQTSDGGGGGKQSAGSVVSLPKGGGAIKGIGETFSPNPFTGTANFTVPIATSPGRSGFGPELSLQYSSGNGNGPFGLGWTLSVPQISLKTEKGIPQYQGKDTYLLSGAEDLVRHDQYPPITTSKDGYLITTYRPRVEGLFARIQHWRKLGDPTNDQNLSPEFWRITTKDNITNIYGRTLNALLRHPDHPTQIFQWFLQLTYDAKGNTIHYEYMEDKATDLPTVPYEEHRRKEQEKRGKDPRVWQVYLKRIRYGNLTPLEQFDRNAVDARLVDIEQRANDLKQHVKDHFFEVVFDYGEHGERDDNQNQVIRPDPDPQDQKKPKNDSFHPYELHSSWPFRSDAYSSYRSAFEIRTYRLCHRVLMFHHGIPNETGPVLVKSTDFRYVEDPHTKVSCLKSVTQRGYRGDEVLDLKDDAKWYESEELSLGEVGVKSKQYRIGSFPPIEFSYTSFKPNNQKFKSFEAVGGDLPPRSLADPNFALVDLFGTGLPDVIQTFPNNFFVWRNLGNGQFDMRRPLKDQPAGITLDQEGVGFGDMAGDGRADLLVHQGSHWHFFEATHQGGWKKPHFYQQQPSFSLSDPIVKMIDLTGEGKSGALRSDDRHFTYFPCLGEKGFGQPHVIRREHSLEDFPDVFFNDPRVRLIDLTGDGLTDIALIHSGRTDLWPNLGHGKWGKRVTMQNTPHFGPNFDPRRLLFADLDGSGPADMVYVESGQVTFWLNQSGNAWSEKHIIHGTPQVTDLDSLEIADMYGTGTSGILYSTDYRGLGSSNYWYLDLTGGIKPYVLTEMTNNLGATTRAEYSTSTQEYLQDLEEHKPWMTTLPFPVKVLKKVEVIDHIGKAKLVTTYRYHHGYYDGREREFRGFGMVEQTDSEVFEDFANKTLHDHSEKQDNINSAFHVPPVLTKTWFHTGVFYEEDITTPLGITFNAEHLLEFYREDYYNKDPWAFRLEGAVLEPGESLSVPHLHLAYRALRGSVLRTEVYALDETEKAEHPYTVTESRYQVKRLQPIKASDIEYLPVFHPVKKETLTYHYERTPLDPRIAHDVTLHVDEYGNVTHAASWVYPRRPELQVKENGAVGIQEEPKRDEMLSSFKEQGKTLGTLTQQQFINPSHDEEFPNDAWFVGVPYETKVFEVHHLDWKWEDYAKALTQQGSTSDGNDFKQPLQEIVLKALVLDTEGHPRTNFWFEDFHAIIPPEGSTSLRLIEWSQNFFRTNDNSTVLDGLELFPPPTDSACEVTAGLLEFVKPPHRLALGKIDSLGLPYETYQAIVPKGMVSRVYGPGGSWDPIQQFPKAGYAQFHYCDQNRRENHYWWIPSGRQAFDDQKFYQPIRTQDPFGNHTTLTYDTAAKGKTASGQSQPFWLLVKSTTDPVQNTITAANDYVVLQPESITDPNGNQSKVQFDPLGLVVGTAVMGKSPNPTEGDSLEEFSPYLTQKDLGEWVESDKPNKRVCEWLNKASTRLIYDLWRPKRTIPKDDNGVKKEVQPAVVATISREHHVSEPPAIACSDENDLPIQLSFTYSDGFGREIQTKAQVESCAANPNTPRWLGSGWTIFNNKGKPVQQFEPFFATNHIYAPETKRGTKPRTKQGVSSTLLYDPLERVVATLHPNHTYEKVVFDPWRQETWDTNDTLLCGLSKEDLKKLEGSSNGTNGTPKHYDPTQDPHIGAWLAKLDAGLYSPTWYHTRIDESLREKHCSNAKVRKAEHCAAQQTEDHAATPTITHLDTFGRAFLTVADNGKKPEAEKKELLQTYTTFDIQGNDLNIRDPRGIDAFQHTVDMTGRKLKIESVDAGTKHMLSDVAGNPIWSKDANQNEVVIHYDALRRPVQTLVKSKIPGSDIFEQFVAEVRFYGDGHETVSFTGSNPETNNLRGQLWKVYDGAGLVHNVSYDFKGNLTTTERTLLANPMAQVRWKPIDEAVNLFGFSVPDEKDLIDLLEKEEPEKLKTYQLTTKFDALNRVVERQEPDGKTTKTPIYNKRNLMQSLTVVPTESQETFVQQVTYNEKGQRASITYGNGVETIYEYDPATFRLLTLTTNRGQSAHGNKRLQALHYTYDPVGNIISIKDDAHQDVFNHNTKITSESTYIYDSTYRLSEATGREHEAMTAFHYTKPTNKHTEHIPLTNQPVSNGQALHNYCEKYTYDQSGNITKIHHHCRSNPARNWTRTQEYDGNSNRLESSNAECKKEAVLNLSKAHDGNGNITELPHLPELQWDYKNQLTQVQLNEGSNPNYAYYQYDSAGQRVRKFLKKGECTEERIYLGEFEIYRRKKCWTSDNPVPDVTRYTVHVMDDQSRVALIEQKKNPADEQQMLSQRIRYQFTNYLGSSAGEVDATKDAGWISYEEYYSYGGTAYFAAKKDDKEFAFHIKLYRYSGKERDDETGLYYYGARYFASWMGRWISTDPVSNSNGKSLYDFNSNNPINRIDRTGLYDEPKTEGVRHIEIDSSDMLPKGIARYVSNSGKHYAVYRLGKLKEAKKRGVREFKPIVSPRDLPYSPMSGSESSSYYPQITLIDFRGLDRPIRPIRQFNLSIGFSASVGLSAGPMGDVEHTTGVNLSDRKLEGRQKVLTPFGFVGEMRTSESIGNRPFEGMVGVGGGIGVKRGNFSAEAIYGVAAHFSEDSVLPSHYQMYQIGYGASDLRLSLDILKGLQGRLRLGKSLEKEGIPIKGKIRFLDIRLKLTNNLFIAARENYLLEKEQMMYEKSALDSLERQATMINLQEKEK